MSDNRWRPDPSTGIDIPKAMIRRLSSKQEWFSWVKISVYLISIAFLALVYFLSESTYLQIAAILFLGVAYAHGVELQHEALHGNLFKKASFNRVAGFLTGIPMLVSFVQYRAYHLHHHRCVGTNRDEELFDYYSHSLRNPFSAFIRIWNLVKIPAFTVAFLNILKGEYPDKVKKSDRGAMMFEYIFMFALLSATILSAVLLNNYTLLMLWIIPWLVIAEPVHFMIEVPEHIGCNRKTRAILKNTRSYPAHPLWAYLINHNNYHIEHHMFPTVPSHRLKLLHEPVRAAQGHYTNGYWSALGEVFRAVREGERR